MTNPKHARFIAEYLLDLNATQAAVRAGYSVKTAKQQGSRLLTNADIAAAIETAQAARVERTGITEARVLAELEGLAFSDLTHYTMTENGDVKVAEGAPAGAMRALQSIKRKVTTRGRGSRAVVTHEVEIRLWDKPGPLKLAGQHVGLFVEKHEHTGKNGKPIQTLTRVVFGGRHKKPDAAASSD